MPQEIRDQLTAPRAVIANLLHHAAFAAHLVGHLDDNRPPDLIRRLGDEIDTVVHALTEMLGDPDALAEQDAAAPDNSAVYDGAPMLTSSAGDAQ